MNPVDTRLLTIGQMNDLLDADAIKAEDFIAELQRRIDNRRANNKPPLPHVARRIAELSGVPQHYPSPVLVGNADAIADQLIAHGVDLPNLISALMQRMTKPVA